MRNENKILVIKPLERPRYICVNNIKTNL